MPILAWLGSFAVKFVGGHLVSALFGRATEAISLFEAVLTGLGLRFMLGFISAFYLFNDDFRHAANLCGEAVLKAIWAIF